MTFFFYNLKKKFLTLNDIIAEELFTQRNILRRKSRNA